MYVCMYVCMYVYRCTQLCQSGNVGEAIDCLSDCLQYSFEKKLPPPVNVIVKRAEVLMQIEQVSISGSNRYLHITLNVCVS